MQSEPLLTWSEPVRQLISFIGLFLAGGAVGFRYTAGRPPVGVDAGKEGPFYIEARGRAGGLGAIGAVIMLAITLMAIPAGAARAHLSATQFATHDVVTIVKLAGWLLAILGFLLAWSRREGGWPATLIGVVCATLSSAFVGRWTSLYNPIHMLAASFWIGTLFVLLACGITPLLRHRELVEQRGSIAANMVNRFSPLALTMGGIVVLFGVIIAWRHLPVIRDLWTTPYGYALIAKLIFVAMVFALGAFNWRRQRPTLGTESAATALRGSARAELSVAGIVLLITAILVSLPAPRRPQPPGGAGTPSGATTPRTRPNPAPR